MKKNYFFDYNASTPVHPDVLTKYNEITSDYSNPSSSHYGGRIALGHIQTAKENIAKTLNCSPEWVWFTSGGTESNNWIIKGLVQDAIRQNKKHFIISSIEHKSILKTAEYIQNTFGIAITKLPVNADGKVEVESLKKSIRPETFMVSLMLANNETGIIQPVKQISEICKENTIFFHTDAVCALGKMSIDFKTLGVDALSLSSHKLYSPKGSGVLILKDTINIEPLIHGCGQQCGMRSGTENTAGAAAFGYAVKLLPEGAFSTFPSVDVLASQLHKGLREVNDGKVYFHGNGEKLSNTISVGFEGCLGTDLLQQLSEKGIFVSAGAAAAGGDASHVLTAMGISKKAAQSTLRISIGWGTDSSSVDYFLTSIKKILKKEPVLS